MNNTVDPIDVLRDLNPVPTGSLRELAAARAEHLLPKLRADEIAAPPIRPYRRRRYVAATTVSAAALAAASVGVYLLATQAGTSQVSPPASTVSPRGGPLSSPTPVTNAAAADAFLPFQVVLPSNVKPTSLGVYQQAHQLVASYDTPGDGAYELAENPTNETVADLQKLAKTWKVGRAEIVVVDGVHVLVQAESVKSVGRNVTVSWIRGDGTTSVLTWLQGPWIGGRTFTEQQALSVAANMIGQGG